MADKINIEIKAKDKASRPIDDITKAVRDLGEVSEKSARKAGRMGKALASMTGKGRMNKMFDAMGRSAVGAFTIMGNALRGLGRLTNTVFRGMMVLGNAVFQNFVKVGIAYQGQMDTYRTTLTTYLRDGDAVAAAMAKKGIARDRAMMAIRLKSSREANGLLLEAQRFAMKTPLSTQGVMKSVNMLVQYGASAKDAMKMTKMLADVSGGSTEKMNLLGIAMSQVAAKTVLQGEEVRQLTNAGYNPLRTIARQTGRSMQDLYKDMREKKITFEMVKKAIEADTSALGKFHNNANALSKTLPGAVSNIKEMYTAIAGKAMEGAYQRMRGIAVQAQEVLGVFADGVIAGKGWGASFDAMIEKSQKMTGWVNLLGDGLVKLRNNSKIKFAANFAQGVNTRVKGGASLGGAVRGQLSQTEGGKGALKMFDMMKGALSRMGTVAKAVGKVLAKAFEAVKPRLKDLGEAFKAMKPIFDNIIAPLIKGVFNGVLSVIDPLIKAIGWLAPHIGKVGKAAKPLKPIFEKVGYVVGMFFGGPILAGIGKFTKGLGLVGKAIGPIGKGLSTAGRIFMRLIGFAFKLASFPIRMNLFFGKFIAGMLGKFLGFIGKITGKFLTWTSVGGAAIARLAGKFWSAFKGALGKLSSGFGKFISGTASAIGKLAKKFGGTIGQGLIAMINKAIDAMNSALDRIRNVSIMGRKPLSGIPEIPRLWNGGLLSGGSAIVGERGAELATMTSRGVQITPAHHLTERRGATAGSLRSALAASMGGGGEQVIAVTSPVVIDGREITRVVTRHTVRRVARA